MGPVFVTGGSGFVGGALVAELVASERPVRALARSDASRDAVLSLGAEPIRGDLDDHAALLEGMRGCTTVFHVAGVNASKDGVPAANAVVKAGTTTGAPRSRARR